MEPDQRFLPVKSRRYATFFLTFLAYFIGAWIYFVTLNHLDTEDARLLWLWLLLPTFIAATWFFLLGISRLVKIRQVFPASIWLAVFTSLSCFLIVADGVGSITSTDSLWNLVKQFTLPAVLATIVLVETLGFNVFYRVHTAEY